MATEKALGHAMTASHHKKSNTLQANTLQLNTHPYDDYVYTLYIDVEVLGHPFFHRTLVAPPIRIDTGANGGPHSLLRALRRC